MKYILPAIFIIILIVFLLTNKFWQDISGGFSSLFKGINSTSSFLYSDKYFNSFSNWGSDWGANYSNQTNTSSFKKEDLSPYYKKVVIEKIKINSAPKYEEIILRAQQFGSNQNLDISGWSLVSNTSQFVIVGAVKELDFKKVFQEKNIVLKNGEAVKIYSTPSPIYVNFKGNQCIGYLNQFYSFIPKLSEECPQISKKDIAHLSGLCQEYILNLKKCELPNNPPTQSLDSACMNYLKNINYNGCFERNKNNLNFYTKDWYVFMGREILDDLHDKVFLFDKNGKIVDEYIY